jgi:uncharacterized protein YgiM (DUF1202 family)
VLALLLAPLAAAQTTVTVKERARVRQAPSAASELVEEVDAGTALQVLGENGGWRHVRAPDGREGYVWSEHLASGEGEAPKPAAAGPPRTVADEVRDLREEVSALRQRPEPATAADLERIRQELERVTTAERELARRLDDRPAPAGPAGPPADPPPESTVTFAPALLAVGALVGFAASRLLQRRRDRRQRNRLRL